MSWLNLLMSWSRCFTTMQAALCWRTTILAEERSLHLKTAMSLITCPLR